MILGGAVATIVGIIRYAQSGGGSSGSHAKHLDVNPNVIADAAFPGRVKGTSSLKPGLSRIAER